MKLFGLSISALFLTISVSSSASAAPPNCKKFLSYIGESKLSVAVAETPIYASLDGPKPSKILLMQNDQLKLYVGEATTAIEKNTKFRVFVYDPEVETFVLKTPDLKRIRAAKGLVIKAASYSAVFGPCVLIVGAFTGFLAWRLHHLPVAAQAFVLGGFGMIAGVPGLTVLQHLRALFYYRNSIKDLRHADLSGNYGQLYDFLERKPESWTRWTVFLWGARELPPPAETSALVIGTADQLEQLKPQLRDLYQQRFAPVIKPRDGK